MTAAGLARDYGPGGHSTRRKMKPDLVDTGNRQHCSADGAPPIPAGAAITPVPAGAAVAAGGHGRPTTSVPTGAAITSLGVPLVGGTSASTIGAEARARQRQVPLAVYRPTERRPPRPSSSARPTRAAVAPLCPVTAMDPAGSFVAPPEPPSPPAPP